MLSILAVFGLCCREKEYATSNGRCCPMCHEGAVVKRDCTPFSGTRCVPCVNGTYMNQPNGLNKCFPCTSCDQGCVAVFMVPGLCCREKEYATSNGRCCPMCHEGAIVKRDCLPWLGPQCVPCLNGTFMPKPNGLKKCLPCTSCDEGLFAKQRCTATSDTVCGVLEGYFCKLRNDTGCSLAQKHTTCESGHRIKTPGTNTSDTECEPCQHGFFSEHGVNCMAWTMCSETQVMINEGDAYSDVVCKGTEPRVHYFLSIPFSLLSLTIVGLLIRGMSKSQKKSDPSRALRDI